MSIRFDHATIRISELQTRTILVGPWETAVLKAMYGEDCEVTGHSDVDRNRPEAGDEFTRLADRYGPKNSDTPLVASVFGSFGPGVRALDKFIQEAVDGELPDEAESVPSFTSELSDEEIDAVMAARAAKQPQIIEATEPKPPIKGKSEVVDNADDLA